MPENTDAFFDQLTELWNSGKPELVTQLYAKDAERVDPNLPQPIRGMQQIAQFIAEVHAGFPDFNIEIKQRIGSGEQIATEWTCTGTHTGVFQGMPATGRFVRVSGVSLYQIRDGKIVAERVYFDRLAMLQQLGAVPGPVQSSKSAAQ